jgi:hypothetical protein
MTTEGTFAWAIEQARAGSAIRRASWPFYWVLVPSAEPPPNIYGTIETPPVGDLYLRHLIEFDERTPSGGEGCFGNAIVYVVPAAGVNTDTCSEGWLRWIVAADWETCSAELPCSRRGPARGFIEGDAVLMLGAGRVVGIVGTPDDLVGFRKITAFVPIDQVLPVDDVVPGSGLA